MEVWSKKVKGSALQFALLIATVVILMLLAFIVLTNTHRFFRIQSNFLYSAIENADTGIKNTLHANQAIEPLLSNDSIEIRQEFLGGYRMISATGSTKTTEFTKKALLGNLEKDNKALYLTNNIQPLVFVGKSKIIGDAYLPERGIKPGMIAGDYFNGETMVTGRRLGSSSQLPKLEPNFDRYISKLLKTLPNSQQQNRNEIEQHSFFAEEKVFFEPNPMDVFETLAGNIILKSTSEIVIHPEATLTDVILVAPIIRIKENVVGRMHLIASDSIIIEKGVKLSYPSSLVLKAANISGEKKSGIVLQGNSQISGIIVFLNSDRDRKRETDIFVNTEAQVKGQVYCQGYLELQGTIEGTVYTNYFLTKASGSRYINHIYDGRIIANSESIQYAGLPIVNSQKTILQWLY